MSNPNNRILLFFSLSLAFTYPSSILVSGLFLQVMTTARARLDDQSRSMREEYEATSALLCVLERIASAEAEVVQVLCASADSANGHLLPTTSNNNNSSSNAKSQSQGQGQGGVGWRGRVGSGVGVGVLPPRTVAFQR